MSVFYHCTMCQHANTSIMDLHNHHIQHHNLEELSQTIINLQGFKVLDNIKYIKKKYLKPITLGDDNNNENIYNHIFTKPKQQNNSIYKNKQVIHSSRKFSHDNTTCSINCSQFIAWEHELNKRKEINDEEFLNIIEGLCNDLSKRKHRGRKKKDKISMEKTNTRNIMQHIENIVGLEDKTVTQLSIESCQTVTSSFVNTKDSNANTNFNNGFLISEIKNEPEDTRNDEITTLQLISINNKDNKVLMPYSPCNNFSWNSIITINDDEEMSVKKNDVYPESVEIDIENFF
ncbi:PREDICTED: uncharacterized protein LOC108550149 [Eufriesea mexicana]|uniref:uncharacterized protein LOC108550149 n=1 Tax=Eufriesea mexicana TaxID=516756 RepID=UPI00083BB2A9|nr:PREDICTED: uncharacterized protein LOC108550149 [Eufriesea mexicana]